MWVVAFLGCSMLYLLYWFGLLGFVIRSTILLVKITYWFAGWTLCILMATCRRFFRLPPVSRRSSDQENKEKHKDVIRSYADVYDLVDDSHPFTFLGFEWLMTVSTRNVPEGRSVSLSCNADLQSSLWKIVCTCSVTIGDSVCEQKMTFDKDNDCHRFFIDDFDPKLIDSIPFLIYVSTTAGMCQRHTFKYDIPDCNVASAVLLVDGRKVHVSRELLAIHSRYFYALFYSDFKERTLSVIPLNDVTYEEFVDLLDCLYPTDREDVITVDSIGGVLKVANYFQVHVVLLACENFLCTTDDIPLWQKLKYADDYQLARLEDLCIKQLSEITSVKSDDFLQLSKRTVDLVWATVDRLSIEK